MFNTLGLILSCQVMAPVMAMHFPPITSEIKIKSVKTYEATPPGMTGRGISEKIRPLPKRVVIELSVGEVKESFVIHLNTKTVHTYSHILNGPRNDSGDIGVALIGLPGLIISSPVLILNSLIWNSIEKIVGMDRYYFNVYLKIKDQVDSDTRALIWEAFRNTSGKVSA